MSEETSEERGAALSEASSYAHRIGRYFSLPPGAGYIAFFAIFLAAATAYVILPCQYAVANRKACLWKDPFSLGWSGPIEPGQAEEPHLSAPADGSHTPHEMKPATEAHDDDSSAIHQSPSVSVGHLEELRQFASAWRNRQRFKTPDAGAVMSSLTDGDRQRADHLGYNSDLQTLQAAHDLLKWPQRGFNARTPVYIYTDSPESNEIKIVNRLKDRLAGYVHFVDEPDAALLIQISNADVRAQTEQSAYGNPVGHTSFLLWMRWLDGKPFFRRQINNESTDESGSGNTVSNRGSIQANATSLAIDEAVGQVIQRMLK